MRKIFFASASLLLLGLSPTGSAAPLTKYSAYVTTTQGSDTSGGKLYVDDIKVRVEAKIQGHESHTIVRPDLGKVYSVLPAEKVYMEIPVTQEEAKLMVPYPPDVKLIPAGEEAMNGQLCDKYKIEASGGSAFLWVSKKNQAPVLMTSIETGIKTEWKDVKPGAPDPALFELPAGYKKLDMPPQGSAPQAPQQAPPQP